MSNCRTLTVSLFTLATTAVAVAMAASMSETLVNVPELLRAGSAVWIETAENHTRTLLTESAVYLLPSWHLLTSAVILLLTLASAYCIWACAFRYMDRVRHLGDIGYVAERGRSMKDMANLVRKRRQTGDIPPVYPNGWFAILESRDLNVGDVKSVSCLGLELAVFRDTSGQAHVVDAYCPHMGASLGVGGQVRGDCIECPFHGWKFRGYDGKCVHVPYAENKHIPESARIKSYISLERNQMIHLWYHAEGIEPNWQVPEIEKITSGDWTYRGRTEHHVNAHIEEIPENGADVAHLSQVHGPFMGAGIDLRHVYSRLWSVLQHTWQGTWTADEDEKHVGTLLLRHRLSVFGKKVGCLDLDVVAKQIGPGIVHMTFESVLGNGAFLHTILPLEPMTQKITHQIYFHWAVPTIIAKFYMLSEALQVERDVMIWNNKRYVSKPIFIKSKEDSLVAKHRRWYSQFYTENSPRLKFQKDTLDF